MNKQQLCFCKSNKLWSKCHFNVVNNSRFVKMYKIYNKIDKEISKQIKEKKLIIECKKGCGECCTSNFGVSELEFCIIVDYLLKKNNNVQIQEIIDKACRIKDYIAQNYPEDLEILNADFTGYTDERAVLLTMNGEPRGKLEKCIFLSDKNTCTIYDVRPLICRTYGTSYFNENYSHKICSKININRDNINKFVDLTQFKKESTYSFSFYEEKINRIHIRRPYPLFYWFIMLRQANLSLNKFAKTKLFARYTLMDEEECAEDIISSINNR